MSSYFVYILAGKKDGTLYIGMTSNLKKRIYEHKMEIVPGFTKKYHVHQLVYVEETPDVLTAIEREKQLKAWKRIGKFNSLKRRIRHGEICPKI